MAGRNRPLKNKTIMYPRQVCPLPTDIREGSWKLAALQGCYYSVNPKELSELFGVVPPHAWMQIEINLGTSTEFNYLDPLVKSLPPAMYLEKLFFVFPNNKQEHPSGASSISKWFSRTGLFQKLGELSLSKIIWTSSALRCFCEGLKGNVSLRKVNLTKGRLPRGGEYYIKEALINRETALPELSLECDTFGDDGRHLTVSYYFISQIVEKRLVSASLKILGLFNMEFMDNFRLLCSAAEKTPPLAGEDGEVFRFRVWLRNLYCLRKKYTKLISDLQVAFSLYR